MAASLFIHYGELPADQAIEGIRCPLNCKDVSCMR